jgi:Spx/MgsR family transcriptional regulator
MSAPLESNEALHLRELRHLPECAQVSCGARSFRSANSHTRAATFQRRTESMLQIYEGGVRKLFNTSGQDYKALNLKDKLPTMSVDQAIDLLSKNGNLVKRPFLLTERGGIVGFKEEEWQKFFA